MRKYYFAYHSVNGIVFGCSWAEDDGITVGGRPLQLITDPVELVPRLADFSLGELERIYPLPLPNPYLEGLKK